MEDRTSSGISNEDHQPSPCKLTNCQEAGPATDPSFKVQIDGESEYPWTKPAENDTVHQLSSSNNVQPEEDDSENALLGICHSDDGSLAELMYYRSSSVTAVTRCMCCEETECGPVAETESRDASFVSFQGKQAVRPRTPLEASQSLPAVLPHPHGKTQERHSQPDALKRDVVKLTPHGASTSHPSSTDPRLLRVCGVLSDSMLSLPNGDICRICHTGRRHEPLISPCVCSGSVKYTHHRCLTTWLAESGLSRCELCGFKYKTKMVGPRNICQWKALRLNLLDRLHLVLFSLSIFLLAGTALYIGWTAVNSSRASSGLDPNSLASQILLPVYSTLSFVSLGIVIFEGKNTCLRLLRRWRALNMGLQIMERELGVDVDADLSCQRALGGEGEHLTSATSSVRGPCELATGEEDLPNFDGWTVWSEAKAEESRPSNVLDLGTEVATFDLVV